MSVLDEQVRGWSWLHRPAVVAASAALLATCTVAAVGRSDAAESNTWPTKQHPYLLFDQKELKTLRAAGDKGLHARMLAHFRTTAAEYVGRPPLPAPPEKVGPKGFLWWHVTAYHTCYEYRHALEVLSFLAILTGEQQYIDAGKRWLLALCKWKYWGAAAEHDRDYPGAWLTAAAAMSYDWLWPFLSEAERDTVRDALEKRIRLVHGRAASACAWDSHAMWIYPATATAVVSVLWEQPEAPTWLDWFRVAIRSYIVRAYTPEGEGVKGVSYFGMMMSEVAVFLESLRHATGEDDFAAPVWRNCIPYVLHCWRGGNYARYFDREQAWDRSLNTLMFLLARRHRSTAAQWVAAHDEKLLLRPFMDDKGYYELGHPSGVLNYVWYDPVVEATVPPETPCAAWFPGIGLVTMRSGWDEDAICLTFKSGIRGPHESFAQNRFTIDAGSQRLTTEFYDDYHTTTDGFNVVTINGKQQQSPERAAENTADFLTNNRIGSITEFVNLPAYAAVRGEARRAYEEDCSRYEREIIYLRPHTFLVIDRVVAKAPADFVWRLHTTGSIALRDNRAFFQLPEASLVLTSIEPHDARLRVGDVGEIWRRHKLRDSQWYAPYAANLWRTASGGRAWPLSKAQWYLPQPILEITPKERNVDATFVTLIQALPKGRQLPLASSEYRGGTLCIAVPGEQLTHRLYYNPAGIDIAGVHCDGDAAAIGRNRLGALVYTVMHRGTRLEVDGRRLARSEHKATVAIDLSKPTVRADSR